MPTETTEPKRKKEKKTVGGLQILHFLSPVCQGGASGIRQKCYRAKVLFCSLLLQGSKVVLYFSPEQSSVSLAKSTVDQSLTLFGLTAVAFS